MRSNASTVAQYLSELPADRREAIEAVRQTILENLPLGHQDTGGYAHRGAQRARKPGRLSVELHRYRIEQNRLPAAGAQEQPVPREE